MTCWTTDSDVACQIHSWTAQENIFGCYKKDQEKHEARFWPFTSTAYEGSTQKVVTKTKQEKELWKQDKRGTNAIWFKNGIYHLGNDKLVLFRNLRNFKTNLLSLPNSIVPLFLHNCNCKTSFVRVKK